MKTKIKIFALISTSCLMLALPISCNSTTKNDPKTLNVVLYNNVGKLEYKIDDIDTQLQALTAMLNAAS